MSATRFGLSGSNIWSLLYLLRVSGDDDLIGTPACEPSVEELFDDIDQDRDGTITFSEFSAYVARLDGAEELAITLFSLFEPEAGVVDRVRFIEVMNEARPRNDEALAAALPPPEQRRNLTGELALARALDHLLDALTDRPDAVGPSTSPVESEVVPLRGQ